ncbi:retrovirus-related pol polyprotein from transposon TNT 1-94 [Tanacetum coccineum]
MLEKSMYDSWASRIRLSIKGKKHGRMMIDSIDNGPLVYPTIEEDGQTRPKNYSELTEAQQLQDDCDVQEINIILHGLPPDVYALVNHQEAAKDIWDRVKLLMKGTKLSYQERECRLYNLFDKFAYQVQVNTKFLNALPPEWSKFVTDVKLAKSLYNTNYDQLYAYLSQHKRHANEVHIMLERYPDPLTLVANSQTLYNPSQSPQHSDSSMCPPLQQFTPVYAAPIHHQQHHTLVNPLQQLVSPQPFISPSVTKQPQAEFPQLDSGLAVPTFQQGEDLIDCFNKAMEFLSNVASRFPPSNNQLRTSFNPRNQATIQDGRVVVQQIQGRQTQIFAGTRNRGIATTSRGNYKASQPRVMKCYNCQGEGHMTRQYTQPKRPINSAWFKEKLMFVEAKEAAFQTEDLDAYDLDCDDISSAKADVQEMQYCEQTHIDDYPYKEINSDSNIIPYSQYLQESQDAGIQDTNSSAPNNLLVLSLVEQMTDHVANLDKENQTNKMVNELLTVELERYKERVAIFEQRQNIDMNKREKLIDFQMDDLIRNRNAKLTAFQQEIDTLKETLSTHVKEKESLSKTLTQSQEKDTVIRKLKERIESLSEKDGVENVKKDIHEIETINIELEHSVAKLLFENENFKEEREHLKSIYKDQFDSIRKIRVQSNEHCASLIAQINEKSVENSNLNAQLQEKFFAIAALKKKLRKLKGKNIIDTHADITTRCHYCSRNELLVYVSKTCPSLTKPTEKLVVVTPMNKDKKVRFRNDHIAKIMGYGDYQMGNVTISRVYYVEGLGHNLFSVGQFCDSNLEVAFRKHTCFIYDLEGVDLLKGSRGSNLYTLSMENLLLSSPICLLSKASKTKSWLWHQRLSHLNFDYITSLAKHGLVRGLPKLKYQKDHLCSACALVRLNATVCNIRTDNGTEFVNQTLRAYYEEVGVSHQSSFARSPQQNNVVERQNRTLVEAARTMLIFLKALLFLWVEAVATACYTQNRSLIQKRHNKTSYELLHDIKPDLSYLYVFGALCYLTNDSEDIGKLKPKADIGIFVGYASAKKAFRINNKRT